MSWAIWITGPPGSGKSALARAVSDMLGARGQSVRVLELDEIRQTVTPRPRYTDAERDIVYRALAYMARLLTEDGVPVIVDATAHRRIWRDLAREAIARFAEVQVTCPPEVCREREARRTEGHAPRGIYARAGRPGATVPGVDVPYEPALRPELVVDSVAESVADGAIRIAELADRLAAGPPAPARSGGAGWAVWITGRPGSGKSTVADRVAAELASRGIRARVLEMAAARRRLLPDRAGSEADHEVLHRAIAYAAKLLTEAGVAVIVTATAPRRAWRQMARQLIPCFAEVQLACPADVCLERERAARWRLAGCPPTEERRRGATPDVVLDYEEAFGAELVLDTGSHDPWTTAEQVLFLVRRLHHSASTTTGPAARRA